MIQTAALGSVSKPEISGLVCFFALIVKAWYNVVMIGKPLDVDLSRCIFTGLLESGQRFNVGAWPVTRYNTGQRRDYWDEAISTKASQYARILGFHRVTEAQGHQSLATPDFNQLLAPHHLPLSRNRK